MDINSIRNADVLDILFEGRNKEYGAYQLRKTYQRRLTTAIGIVIATCSLLFMVSKVAGENDKNDDKIHVKDLSFTKHAEPEKQPEKIVKPLPKPKAVKVEVIKFVVPKIVHDEEAKDPPPSVDDLTEAQIGTFNQTGEKNIDVVAPPIESISTGPGDAPKNKEEDYEGKFVRIEKEARFPRGSEAWRKFLERNLNSQVAADDGAPAGSYTVKVQFIVDKEGTVSNISVLEVPKECPSCGPEAIKVIRKSHKWEPAIQNGRPVTFQAVQQITFQVEE